MNGDSSKRQRQTVQLNAQLARNRLLRRPNPEGTRSLFRAVSDSLYFTTAYVDELIQLCRSTLDLCLDTHTLPSKLAYLYQKPYLVNDYRENPDLSAFQKMHLQLISHAYNRRVIVYYVGDDYYLNYLVIGDKFYPKCILLSKIDNYYTAVIEQDMHEVAQLVREAIYQKLMLESDKVSQEEHNRKKPRRHSLSACDELEYMEIFKSTKTNFDIPRETQPNTLRKTISLLQDDDQALELINECKPTPKQPYPGFPGIPSFGLIDYPPYRMQQVYQSEKIIPSISHGRLPAPPNPQPVRPRPKSPEANKRYTGRLKFFDENKNYGFIVMDADNTDIFVHYDDLHKAGMTKQFMRTTKQGVEIRFSFMCMNYIGKYDKSRKAVQLVPETVIHLMS